AWQGVAMFSNKHAGCKKVACQPAYASPAESLAKGRRIQDIGADEAFVGSDIAQLMKIAAGDKITLLGQAFKVQGTLAPTGTVDDSRVFAHLHTVQRIAQAGTSVNAIELTACCEDAAGNLISRLEQLFDDAKVVT